MRRALDLALWLVLLGLPPCVAVLGPGDAGGHRFEEAFVSAQAAGGDELGPAWHAFFERLAERLGAPRWAGRRLGVAVSWFLLGLALALLVAAAEGLLCAALALVALACHPLLRGLGAWICPWGPAAALALVALAFLQALVARRLARRPIPETLVPVALAAAGSGLSLGLAASADARVAWVVLVPSLCFLLACVGAGAWQWRAAARARRGPIEPAVALLRRTLPWALAWFVSLGLFVEVSGALGGGELAARLAGLVPPASVAERVLAWVALPGILLLARREAQRLAFSSRVAGSSVLLLTLAVCWCRGPALDAKAGPLERLLACAVFAASVAVLVPRSRSQSGDSGHGR